MNKQSNDRLITLAGQVAEMFSFNRSIGQLYAYLYFAEEAKPLTEVAAACRMSKGNASIQLRTLENWGAVVCSWKPGTRKDYYSANGDLRGLLLRRCQEGFGKRLIAIRQGLDTFKREPDTGFTKDRLSEIESLLQEVESAFALVPKLIKLKRFFK